MTADAEGGTLGRAGAPFRAGWLDYPAGTGLRDLDVAFGRLLAEQAPAASDAALRLAVLCSARLGEGHPCLDLAALHSDWHALLPAGWMTAGGARPAWLADNPQRCLARAAFVGDGSGGEPLVLHGHRLFLARYWRAGVRIRAAIRQLLAAHTPESASVERTRLWLDRVFGHADQATLDWQRIACAVALSRGFAIITGGPGTGKTRTVLRLLATLQGLAQERGLTSGLRIRLAAPTGKAAARLDGSVAGALADLWQGADEPLRQALAQVPSEVVTLHRLLGARRDTRHFTHHRGHRLDLDVLVVDEASMMDVEMTDALLAALPDQARLVLLGDRDQLASVEAGAVLGELCARAAAGHYTPARCAEIEALCGQSPAPQWRDPDGTVLDQAVVMLRHSYRFSEGSGIGRLAAAVNAGDVPGVAHVLAQSPPDLSLVQARTDAALRPDWLDAAAVLGDGGYGPLLDMLRGGAPDRAEPAAAWDRWAQAVLAQQARFQVLCALREGPWGVAGVNQRIEARLREGARLPRQHDAWYPGRPVLVEQNQPALGLANGDIGVTLQVPDPSAEGMRMLRVAFAGSRSQSVRWVSPARLGRVQTAWALTVHKSQGSEFERVALVLPDQAGMLLTRELLYTGITRARRALVLVLPARRLLDDAVRRPAQRAGGIWDPDA